MSSGKIGVKTYLTLSFISGAVMGLIVWGGVRKIDEAFIWGGVTFIVVLVGIATLELMGTEDKNDPNEPRLK